MAMDIKQAYRRLIEEAFGRGNVGVFDEICDPGYRSHETLTGDADLRQEKDNCRMYRAAFPDIQVTFLGAYTEGDTCIVHWRMTGTHRGPFLGVEPKGVRGTIEGINVGRFRGGKLVESWGQWDALGLLRQLGVSLAPAVGERDEMRAR